MRTMTTIQRNLWRSAMVIAPMMLLVSTIQASPPVDASHRPVEDGLTTSVVSSKGFREYQILVKHDWITFYVHSPEKASVRNMVLFLNGSTPDPTFSFERKDGKMHSYFWGPHDYKTLGPDYAYVVIAKRGLEGAIDEAIARPTPAIYLQKNSLDYRVWQADEVINFCYRHVLKNPRRLVVYGHSEGSSVAAKLGTVNRRITHLGFWCGNALPDYFDFVFAERKEFLSGHITDAEAEHNIDGQFESYRKIFASPQDTSVQEGGDSYTHKRWSSYAEPPINNLVRIKIPLYVQVATLDENAPVESSYLIPLEFTRLGKRNLTFKVGVGWHHGLNGIDGSGKQIGHWDEVFRDFIRWSETTSSNGY